MMSFFNLTQLGVQNPIKHAVAKPSTASEMAECQHTVNRTTLSEPVYPNSEANGSYVKYTERLTKHIRNERGPNEIFHRKVTTNMEYSSFMKDGVQKELWTKCQRRPMIQSEMTKFVNDMTLTNREFMLF